MTKKSNIVELVYVLGKVKPQDYVPDPGKKIPGARPQVLNCKRKMNKI